MSNITTWIDRFAEKNEVFTFGEAEDGMLYLLIDCNCNDDGWKTTQANSAVQTRRMSRNPQRLYKCSQDEKDVYHVSFIPFLHCLGCWYRRNHTRRLKWRQSHGSPHRLLSCLRTPHIRIIESMAIADKHLYTFGQNGFGQTGHASDEDSEAVYTPKFGEFSPMSLCCWINHSFSYSSSQSCRSNPWSSDGFVWRIPHIGVNDQLQSLFVFEMLCLISFSFKVYAFGCGRNGRLACAADVEGPMPAMASQLPVDCVPISVAAGGCHSLILVWVFDFCSAFKFTFA